MRCYDLLMDEPTYFQLCMQLIDHLRNLSSMYVFSLRFLTLIFYLISLINLSMIQTMKMASMLLLTSHSSKTKKSMMQTSSMSQSRVRQSMFAYDGDPSPKSQTTLTLFIYSMFTLSGKLPTKRVIYVLSKMSSDLILSPILGLIVSLILLFLYS